jgi:hypothetical protein
VNARWRAAALPVSYTTRRDMTKAGCAQPA